MKICVLGLGKLGYPMAQFLSSSGYTIKCYDSDKNLIKKLQTGINPYKDEKGLENLKNNNNDIIVLDSIFDALKNTRICFITVPTPSLKNGSFSNKIIKIILSQIANFIKKGNKGKNYLININSTVSPDSFSKDFIPFMKNKGLKNHIDYSFIYNPYFVALGNVVTGLENPDIILIGCDNEKAKKIILNLYKKIYSNVNFNQFEFLNLKEAELVKLLVNCYLTLKISYSNLVSDISEQSKNINLNKILKKIGLDSRIGNKFLSPGGPFSGPCLPRDNYALKYYFKKKNYLTDAVIKTNKNAFLRIVNYFKQLRKKGLNSIIFAGLGYKSHTNSLEETFIIDLIKKCNLMNMKTYYFDNYITLDEKKYKLNFLEKISYKDINKKSKLIFLPYMDKKFFKLQQDYNFYIFDIWHQLPKTNKIIQNSADIMSIKNFK